MVPAAAACHAVHKEIKQNCGNRGVYTTICCAFDNCPAASDAVHGCHMCLCCQVARTAVDCCSKTRFRHFSLRSVVAVESLSLQWRRGTGSPYLHANIPSAFVTACHKSASPSTLFISHLAFVCVSALRHAEEEVLVVPIVVQRQRQHASLSQVRSELLRSSICSSSARCCFAPPPVVGRETQYIDTLTRARAVVYVNDCNLSYSVAATLIGIHRKSVSRIAR